MGFILQTLKQKIHEKNDYPLVCNGPYGMHTALRTAHGQHKPRPRNEIPKDRRIRRLRNERTMG